MLTSTEYAKIICLLGGFNQETECDLMQIAEYVIDKIKNDAQEEIFQKAIQSKNNYECLFTSKVTMHKINNASIIEFTDILGEVVTMLIIDDGDTLG